MIYFLLFFILLFSGMSVLFSKKSFYIPSFFILAFLIMLSMFRMGTGTDFYEYSLIWNVFSYSDSIAQLYYEFGNIEIGYKFLAFVSGYFNKEFYWFLFINATLSLGFSFIGLYRIRSLVRINLIFCFFIYFSCFLIAYNFNAMRQAIVMGLFLLSLKDIIEDNKIKLLIIISIAISLHSSGMFILISYLMSKIKYNYYKLSFYLVGLGMIVKFLNISNVFFSFIGFEKYNYFSESWGAAGYMAILLRVALFIFIAYYIRSQKYNSPIMMMFLFYSVGLMFYFFLLDAGMLASRVNMFFRVLEVVILSNIVVISKKTHRVIAFFIITVFCFAQLYIATLVPDNIYIFNDKII